MVLYEWGLTNELNQIDSMNNSNILHLNKKY